MKRKNPYTSLLDNAKRAFFKVQHPRRKPMFFFSNEELRANTLWPLGDVSERVQAADTLGWDVILEAKSDGLYMTYRERVEVPWEFRA